MPSMRHTAPRLPKNDSPHSKTFPTGLNVKKKEILRNKRATPKNFRAVTGTPTLNISHSEDAVTGTPTLNKSYSEDEYDNEPEREIQQDAEIPEIEILQEAELLRTSNIIESAPTPINTPNTLNPIEPLTPRTSTPMPNKEKDTQEEVYKLPMPLKDPPTRERQRGKDRSSSRESARISKPY